MATIGIKEMSYEPRGFVQWVRDVTIDRDNVYIETERDIWRVTVGYDNLPIIECVKRK